MSAAINRRSSLSITQQVIGDRRASDLSYPVTLYPVSIEPDSNTKDPHLLPERPIECPDEENFIQALGEILSRPQVRKVISLLIVQSRENS